MIALGVPAALLLGLVAELAGTAVLGLAGRAHPWFRPARDLWRDLGRLVRRRDRASAFELAGTATALTGAGLAAAAAIGFLPGNVALVYPALVLAVMGGHLTASLAPGAPRWDPAVRARTNAVLVEPAFALAFGATLLRWGAFDLQAVRGAQQVLGPGVAVGPPVAAIGLLVAAAVALVAGGLRLPPLREGRLTRRRPAASAVAAALCRWGAAGATAMVLAVPLAGGSSLASGAVDAVALLRWAGTALVAALGLGILRAGVSMLVLRRVPMVAMAIGAFALAAVATALVALG